MLKIIFDIIWVPFYLLFNSVFYFLIPKVRERISFEKENYTDEGSVSFFRQKLKGDVAFEVSSEGELEQVRPLIMRALKNKKNVELIYCSPSVDRQVKNLFKQYPQNLRYLRYPILTYWPWRKDFNLFEWLSSKNLIMCRYDFFPEIIFYGKYRAEFFALVSATVKNIHNQKLNFVKLGFYNFCYKIFDFFVTPTEKDSHLFQIHFGIEEDKIETFDFRTLQIEERLKNSEETLNAKFTGYKFIDELMSEYKGKSLVLGSFWTFEAQLLDQKIIDLVNKKELFVSLVPHDVGFENIGRIKLALKQRFKDTELYVIDSQTKEEDVEQIVKDFRHSSGILIIAIKGVLCEFYSKNAMAFVGGGHGRSVHSLLEPYLANCHLLCGPKVHRSTEYDIATEHSPDHISIVNDHVEFTQAIQKYLQFKSDSSKRAQFLLQMNEVSHKIYQKIESHYD